MIELKLRSCALTKRVALAISRGSSAGSTSWLVELVSGGIAGLGEAAEYEVAVHHEHSDRIESDLNLCRQLIKGFHPLQRDEIERALVLAGIGTSARSAIDMALYDWAGKSTNLPVWKYLGLSPLPRGPVSVTIGINSPEGAQQRLRQWQAMGKLRAIKIKLGAPAGLEADKAMFMSVKEVAPPDCYLGVDANGGWTLAHAIEMSAWLKTQGAVHIEQPLAVSNNAQLASLQHQTQLPIFIDESCRSSRDVADLGRFVDGINIKITKCGGLSEAMRMISTANAMGLKTMVGCYGNSTVGNSAAHQLASLIDYIDLDSHLNISNDPCLGCEFRDGYLVNSDRPGLGVQYA
jgi:L-Ala-D/L-Glu epimerase